MEEETSMKQRAVPAIRATTARPLKKVQVVYYLTRNGHLEHPHYMEVSLLHHHQLRLQDVIHRLTALRGKGMPCMYSWSCKRSYKNGYVWNDLSENDIIRPAAGAEYVLKGSEIIENGPGDQEHRFQPSQVYNRQITEGHQNRNPKRSTESQIMLNNNDMVDYARYGEQDCGGPEEYDEEEKTSYTSSTTPQSRCSRGVATDEVDETEPNPKPEPETKPVSEPHYVTFPATKPKPSHTRNRSQDVVVSGNPRFSLGRNSVLLQLISCGNIPNSDFEDVSPPPPEAGKKHEVRVSDEQVMIQYMPENPRFGNLQSEEKEYYSGSIVEAIDRAEQPQVVLKRSNSYSEERRCLEEKSTEGSVVVGGMEDRKREMKAVAKGKGKCIPLMMDGFLKKS